MRLSSLFSAIAIIGATVFSLLGLMSCNYETGFTGIACERTADCTEGAVCRSGYCAFDEPPVERPDLARVQLSPVEPTLVVGQEIQFTAQFFDEDDSAVEVDAAMWSVSDDSVGTVDSGGFFVGLAVGTTEVSVSADGVVASTLVTVIPPVESIEVTGPVELPAGTRAPYNADVTYATGSAMEAPVVWTVEPAQLANISSDGELFAQEEVGSVTVKATVGDVSGSLVVEIIEAVPHTLEIVGGLDESNLGPGPLRVRSDAGLVRLEAVIKDERGRPLDGFPVRWKIEGPMSAVGANCPVGDLEPDGTCVTTERITPSITGEGEAKYVAELVANPNISDELIIEVYEPEFAVLTIDGGDRNLPVGASEDLSATAMDEDGETVSDAPVEWTSSDPDVVTVDEATGALTAVGPGTATVTASSDNGMGDSTVEGTITVTVEFKLNFIAAGDNHTCGVAPGGTLWCWGDGTWGRLGTGSSSSSDLPVRVDTSAVAVFDEVAAGDQHTCARSGGQVYCWGLTASGRLGMDTDPDDSDIPNPVDGAIDFEQISTLNDHTCGVDVGGAIYCWGRGSDGRLGDGAEDARRQPTEVDHPGADDGRFWVEVSAGHDHSCALDDMGTAWCWGLNDEGQLGDDSTTKSSSPVSVDTSSIGDPTFASISAGRKFTCAVDTSNTTYCWGDEEYGRLGDSTVDSAQTTPVLVEGGHAFSAITTGREHACALESGNAYCWGRANDGRLGNGDTSDDKDSPDPVTQSEPFTMISAGRDFTCALTDDKIPMCWGKNSSNQLGSGLSGDQDTPVQVWP